MWVMYDRRRQCYRHRLCCLQFCLRLIWVSRQSRECVHPGMYVLLLPPPPPLPPPPFRFSSACSGASTSELLALTDCSWRAAIASEFGTDTACAVEVARTRYVAKSDNLIVRSRCVYGERVAKEIIKPDGACCTRASFDCGKPTV